MSWARGRSLQSALAAKRATRQALAALPFEEKIRRVFQMQANTQALRNSPIVRRDRGALPVRTEGREQLIGRVILVLSQPIFGEIYLGF